MAHRKDPGVTLRSDGTKGRAAPRSPLRARPKGRVFRCQTALFLGSRDREGAGFDTDFGLANLLADLRLNGPQKDAHAFDFLFQCVLKVPTRRTPRLKSDL